MNGSGGVSFGFSISGSGSNDIAPRHGGWGYRQTQPIVNPPRLVHGFGDVVFGLTFAGTGYVNDDDLVLSLAV